MVDHEGQRLAGSGEHTVVPSGKLSGGFWFLWEQRGGCWWKRWWKWRFSASTKQTCGRILLKCATINGEGDTASEYAKAWNGQCDFAAAQKSTEAGVEFKDVLVTHIEIPGFTAFSEFPHTIDLTLPAITDACMPCASLTCQNAVLAWNKTPQELAQLLVNVRARDIGKGWFVAGSGQNLDEVEDDVAYFTSIKTSKTPMGSDPSLILSNLNSAIQRGNPCLLNLADAANLPNNEPGVQYHGVAVGGYDDTLGYLIANGDEYPFGHVGSYWVSEAAILTAKPYGLLEYQQARVPNIPVALSAIAQAEAILQEATLALAA